jgi:CheY-like chemotaxis protein
MKHEKKKILLADDNQSFLMYMRILLRRMSFQVILSENGAEVLKLIKLMQPNLVFLDCVMPMLDGISVLRYVHSEQLVPFNIDVLGCGVSARLQGIRLLRHPAQARSDRGTARSPAKLHIQPHRLHKKAPEDSL